MHLLSSLNTIQINMMHNAKKKQKNRTGLIVQKNMQEVLSQYKHRKAERHYYSQRRFPWQHPLTGPRQILYLSLYNSKQTATWQQRREIKKYDRLSNLSGLMRLKWKKMRNVQHFLDASKENVLLFKNADHMLTFIL